MIPITPARLLAAALACAGLILLGAGTAPFGRVLQSAGLPGLALPLLSAPAERAAALYQSGAHSAAAEIYAGLGDHYNHGLAEAQAQDFSAALAAWERRLAEAPGDAEARANYDLIASLHAGVTLEDTMAIRFHDDSDVTLDAEIAQGNARASGSGDEVNQTNPGMLFAEVESSGLRRVPKLFDAQRLAASPRWLTTLPDQPGFHLKARIKAEHKARLAAGTAPPPAGDPR